MNAGEHFGLACALAGLMISALLFHAQSRQIDQLNRQVACLQHPTHAISALGPVGLQGPVGVSTASLVVCP